jgi:hypothetical protein
MLGRRGAKLIDLDGLSLSHITKETIDQIYPAILKEI